MADSLASLDATLARMHYGRALMAELLMENKSDPWIPYAQPLLDAVDLFESLRIGYALIGGIAAMYYGRARFTEDVDFVADQGHMDVLAAHAAEMEQHHFDAECTFKLYHRSGVRVDLCKDEYAADIIRRSREVLLAGRSVKLIDPTDLAAMKLRARRLKDDYDLSEMIAAKTIDESGLQAMVDVAAWAHFQSIKLRVLPPPAGS